MSQRARGIGRTSARDQEQGAQDDQPRGQGPSQMRISGHWGSHARRSRSLPATSPAWGTRDSFGRRTVATAGGTRRSVASALSLTLVLFQNGGQLVDQELHVVEYRVLGGGQVGEPLHDGLVIDLELGQRLVEPINTGAELIALLSDRGPALLERLQLVPHVR